MELNNFIKNIAAQFDDTDVSVFAADTNFRELDEWSSLVALAVLNMLEKKYAVKLLPTEMRSANTIQELFDLVKSKQ
ncbi:acyl carrier protein [Bacteroidia bacterium]|nr:acyl carrier protein [Bacteroidia bacterium]GHU82923.1 acyl carrier protein [Bacteroidia bacterium]